MSEQDFIKYNETQLKFINNRIDILKKILETNVDKQTINEIKYALSNLEELKDIYNDYFTFTKVSLILNK